jgi:mannose-1-phosphate guanylyltransferase
MGQVRRAMVLAAGLGKRLLPITERLPKPLIPVLDRPLIAHTLTLLKQHGIEKVIINLHHLPGLIPAMIGDGSAYGVEVSYSSEPELLGTGGGLKKVESFFSGGTFVLINGDILCDVDLGEAIAEHRAKGAMATMVVRDRDYERFGTIEVDPSGKVRRILGEGLGGPDEPTFLPAMFTGVHVLEPEFLGHIPAGGEACIIRTAYRVLVSEGGPVAAYWHKGYWNDLGSPGRYLSATMALLHGRARLSHVTVPDTVSAEARLGEKARVRPPAIIGPRALIGAGARVGPGAVLGEDANVGPESDIQDSIVFPGAEVSGKVKGEILTPWCRIPHAE